MKRIPGSREVGKAIRGVRKQVKAALKATNVLAGRRIAKGDYATAEALAEKGKAIQQFHAEALALEQQWRELSSVSKGVAKQATTPLWQFYQPILQALIKAGGECPQGDLEELVERIMSKSLLTGDHEAVSRGRKRWQAMIQRARKPLAAEGWIERRVGATWRVTREGREAASRPAATEAQMPTRTPG